MTDMSYMFYNCSSLTSLDLGLFKTKKGNSFNYMFNSCTQLNWLNLSNFYTLSGKQINNIFDGCISLTVFLKKENILNIIDYIPDYVNQIYI